MATTTGSHSGRREMDPHTENILWNHYLPSSFHDQLPKEDG